MKKLLFLLLAAPLMGLQVMADSVKPESLEGIWQQVQVSKTDGHTMLLPVWKVLRSDGTFSTFLIVNRSGQSVITNEGTYKMVNDSTIVEHITGSITDHRPTTDGERQPTHLPPCEQRHLAGVLQNAGTYT